MLTNCGRYNMSNLWEMNKQWLLMLSGQKPWNRPPAAVLTQHSTGEQIECSCWIEATVMRPTDLLLLPMTITTWNWKWTFIIDYFNRIFTLSDGKDIYFAAVLCVLSVDLNNCFTYVLFVNLAISDHNVLAEFKNKMCKHTVQTLEWNVPFPS